MNKDKNLIDILLDDDNCENVTLVSDDGIETEFEQVAIIPIEDKVYALLHPIEEMDGVAEDEAIVFFIDEEKGILTLEQDIDIIDEVFEEYYDLLNDEED